VNRTGPGESLRNGIYAGSLNSTDAHLVSSEIDGNVGFAGGYMFFVAEGGLKAQPFDSERLQLTGQPVPIVQHELASWDRVFFHHGFSVSDDGTAVFQSRIDFAPELVWTDASGIEHGQIRGGYWGTAISPCGRFVAVSSEESNDGKQYICIHDFERGVTTRITDGGREWHPSWTPAGDKIIYDLTAGYTSCTYEISADGSGSIMVGPGIEAQFSPDGKWLAFTEPGGSGIAVRPFPALRPPIKISAGPAAQSRWSRDGTQLFYMAPDKRLMAVSFDPRSGRAGPPHALFQTRIVRVSMASHQYDVAPDGRFLINSLPAGSPPLTLLAGCNSLFKESPK